MAPEPENLEEILESSILTLDESLLVDDIKQPHTPPPIPPQADEELSISDIEIFENSPPPLPNEIIDDKSVIETEIFFDINNALDSDPKNENVLDGDEYTIPLPNSEAE